MNEDKPLVSIIMNCHNGEKYLEESLKSVLAQTYKNWELIFWDNVSSDNSKDLISKYLDKRIKYFYSKNFYKLYKSRNLAIENASGKFISFLDTDDIWEKDKIEKQINFFNQHTEYEIVYSNYFVYDQIKKKKYIQFKNRLASGIIFNDLIKNYTVGIVTVCLKRKIFDSYSFNSNLDIIGDFDLFLRLSEKKKIGYIHDPLATYRIHQTNMSKKKVNLHINEMKNWIKEKKLVFENPSKLRYLNFQLFKLKLKNFLNIF